MTHREKMQAYLSGFQIELPVEAFVSVTSNIYHGFEARNYDERHFSIEYSKKYWTKVTDYISKQFAGRQVAVLDFGCGTGFATERLIESKLNPNISRISCYDLSEAMVAICKEKFDGDDRLSFFADEPGRQQLLATRQKFDIIVCNALMHHILEPEAVFKMIDEMLNSDGIFVMGHEPNKNFYRNAVLQSVSKVFRIYKRVYKRLFLRNKKSGPSADIAVLTHQELLRQGIVPADFPAKIIPKFVDIHVPLSNYAEQPWGEQGFDLNYVNQFLHNHFKLITQITYSHIKDQEAYRSVIWRNLAGLLSGFYPKDGADSIFVFKKSH